MPYENGLRKVDSFIYFIMFTVILKLSFLSLSLALKHFLILYSSSSFQASQCERDGTRRWYTTKFTVFKSFKDILSTAIPYLVFDQPDYMTD